MEPRAALEALNQQLSDPGASTLYRSQKNKGLGFTQKQVSDFVKQLGSQTTYAAPQKAAGKVGAETTQSRYAMDMVDYKDTPSKGLRWILVVQGIYTRQLYTKATGTKRPQDVGPALEAILGQIKDADGNTETPTWILSDGGTEWQQETQAVMAEKGIIHRQKEVGAKQDMATLDNAIGRLKKSLSIAMDRSKTAETWSDVLPRVTRAMNERPTEALVGEAPADIRDSELGMFLTSERNADALSHNERLRAKRTKTLREAGAYRRPKLGLGAFKRGHKPKYLGKERIQEFSRGMVKSRQNEKPTNIKLVLPVAVDSSARSTWSNMDLKDAKKREKVEDIGLEIYEFLEDGKKSLSVLARHLKAQLGGDAEYKAMLGLIGQGGAQGALSALIKLFGDSFELLPSDSGKANYYVQRKD